MNPKKETENSKLETILYNQIVEAGLPNPEREYRFHSTRKWRVDFAFVQDRVAVELEGGSFGAPIICQTCKKPVMIFRKDGKPVVVRRPGRHQDPVSFEKDIEKYNELALEGWTLIRITKKLINEHKAIELIKRALGE